MILIIETSSVYCSVALCSLDGTEIRNLIAEKTNTHSEQIPVMVEKIFLEDPTVKDSLCAIVVSKGPGSYTGLRIGTSLAKGLCYALQIPLISANAFLGMAAKAMETYPDADGYISMLDARREDVYAQVFDSSLENAKDIIATTLSQDSFEYLKEKYIVICGNSNHKWERNVSLFSRVQFCDLEPQAMYLKKEAIKKYLNNEFEDTAYYEPFYLKDFSPGISKKFTL